MELAALVFTDVAVSIFILLFGPAIFAWITNRWLKFKHADFKAHVLFWLITVVAYYFFDAVIELALGPLDEELPPEEMLNQFQVMSNVQFVLSFLFSLVLVRYLFRVNWLDSLKANIAFVFLFGLIVAIFAILFVFFGLSLIFGN